MNAFIRTWTFAAALVAVTLGGCGGDTPVTSQGPPPEPVPIRRLTNAEYTTSVTDLFPAVVLPELTFVPDTRVLGFSNVSSAQTGSLVRMEQYEAAALKVAEAATADPTALTGCDAETTGETACAQPYLEGLAKRAYRRPLTDAEKAALGGLFLLAENGDYRARLTMAIAGVLLSPKFLFRPELGQPASPAAGQGGQGAADKGVVPLTSWEVATRLSYLINGSIPDADLTAAADENRLQTAAEIGAQARRLLALPRSQEHLVKMHEMWLRIDSVGSLSRDEKKYPGFTSGLALAMGQETRLFIRNVLFTEQGTFKDLLVAPYTFANADLAALYGAPAPATDWDRIPLDPQTRSGLLTQASLLATLSKDVSDEGGTPIGTPVARGKFVLEQLLCRTVPPPSAEVQAMFPRQDLTKTARDASEEHRVSAVCAGCHSALDPLGLPFEHYDALGQWRDDDRGMPIDASGSINTSDEQGNGKVIPFDGVPALSRLVAELPETRACYVSQWLRFSTGKLNADTDQAYIDWLAGRFTGGKKIVDLLVDIVTSSAFRHLKTGVAP